MCSALLIDKIVKDILKTTDKTLQKNNHDGCYRQTYQIAIEINLFVTSYFHVTVDCFHAMGQKTTCTTSTENVWHESVMAVPTLKSGIL